MESIVEFSAEIQDTVVTRIGNELNVPDLSLDVLISTSYKHFSHLFWVSSVWKGAE